MTAASMDLLRENAHRFKDKYRSGVILLGAAQDEKVNFRPESQDLTAKLRRDAGQAGGPSPVAVGRRLELAQAGGPTR